MARRDELLSAAIWASFGACIVVASWRMDRLGDRGINPWSVPGLTPGVIGTLMILLALALAWQALRADVSGVADDASAQPSPLPGSARRTLLAALLCVLFAGITLGHGLPFAAEGAAFIFTFTTIFSWPTWREERRIGRGIAQTLAIAVVASLLISWLFESVFLVRLP